METKNDRLRRARYEAGYEHASEAAKEAGWAPSTYSAHENGNRGFKRDVARTYAEFFGVKLDWLLTGRDPMRSEDTPQGSSKKTNIDQSTDYSQKTKQNDPLEFPTPGTIDLNSTSYYCIPRYDARLSAGPGSLLANEPEPIGYFLVEQQWLRTVTLAGPQFLAILQIDGDSMEPSFSSGDWIAIDTTQRSITREGVYALRIGESVWIKRLSLNLREKTVKIMSDNQFYETQEIEESEIEIIGRALCIVLKKV